MDQENRNQQASQEQEGRRSQSQANQEQDGNSRKGFASMDPEKQREIASKGGKAAHESGHAHEFTPEEAREAGHKGGQARHHEPTR